LAAIGSSPPGTLWLHRMDRADARDGRPSRRAVPSCPRRGLIAPIPALAFVTLTGRVPTTCLALSTRECKLGAAGAAAPGRARRGHASGGQNQTWPGTVSWEKLGTGWFGLRAVRRGRYNRSMSATEKLAISLPKDLIEKLRRAKDEGRIESVSGYITDLLRREDDWRDARATLDRIFERCPGPEAKHYAWARQVLGIGPKPAA